MAATGLADAAAAEHALEAGAAAAASLGAPPGKADGMEALFRADINLLRFGRDKRLAEARSALSAFVLPIGAAPTLLPVILLRCIPSCDGTAWTCTPL